MTSDMNVDKKHRAHKGKSKTSEGRKQLNSVRVIQRNLVYVVGLPLSFAEEEVSTYIVYWCRFNPTSLGLIVIFVFSAASPAQRSFWSVWKGDEGICLSDSNRCHTTFCKQHMQCVSSNSIVAFFPSATFYLSNYMHSWTECLRITSLFGIQPAWGAE